MFGQTPRLRRIAVCFTLLLAGWSTAAVAIDPLTLILLRLLRDQIITRSLEAVATPAAVDPTAPTHQPLTIPAPEYDLGDARLKMLIDEGFVHLLPAQRQEVFLSVKKMLADPKNAAAQAYIVQELALKASAVRQAHERMIRLTQAEKQAIAAQAREEYVRMDPEERELMVTVLRTGGVPIPRDLAEMILAEFARPLLVAGPN